MNHRIRVLGIAPYEGMKTLMSSVVADYPQIDLTLFVGDMEQGLEIARSNFHGDYDVVISRGGTAKMLQKNLALPVIEIDISMYDILCALKLADGLTGKTAMVSFANITSSAHLLCDLMKYNMDIYTIDSAEAVEPTLRQLQKNDYQSILCDMISNTTAKRLGLNSFLITSGVDSIRKAFDQALLLCRSQQRLRDENQFFRQLIQGQIGQTMVFDQDGNLFLSTLDDPKPELLELLRRDLPESQLGAERRITREFGQDALCHPRPAHLHRQSYLHRFLFRCPKNASLPKSGRHSFFHPSGKRKTPFTAAFSASPVVSATISKILNTSAKAPRRSWSLARMAPGRSPSSASSTCEVPCGTPLWYPSTAAS